MESKQNVGSHQADENQLSLNQDIVNSVNALEVMKLAGSISQENIDNSINVSGMSVLSVICSQDYDLKCWEENQENLESFNDQGGETTDEQKRYLAIQTMLVNVISLGA